MKTSPSFFEAKSGKPRYTNLSACISEEEDGYTVEVRLFDETKPENSAWCEEIVDSFETASDLVSALAGEFSIGQAGLRGTRWSDCSEESTAQHGGGTISLRLLLMQRGIQTR